jgi:hypothetical protein
MVVFLDSNTICAIQILQHNQYDYMAHQQQQQWLGRTKYNWTLVHTTLLLDNTRKGKDN